MTTKIRRLLAAALFAAMPMLAEAQTISPLAGVTVTSPGSGQTTQNYSYLCSVSGCATGTVFHGTGLVQGNALLSATNGLFSNMLQGNAALSATNGLYTNILQGNAAISATNGLYYNLLQGNAVISSSNPIFAQVTNTLTALVNNADSIAPVSSVTSTAGNSPVNGYNYLFDGTNWDRARGTTGGAAQVNAASGSIAAGASVGDPCMFGTKTNLPISTNATALTQIIALSGTTKIYICSLNLVAPAATAFNLVGGTGTNCAAAAAAIVGSTTAANGMSFAANGGLTIGNGSGVIAVGAAGSELCTLQSNAVQVAGNLTYVQQ